MPSNVKPMTDDRIGSFSIMHMSASTPGAPDRDAAARRVSEAAVAASQRFNMAGYQPLRRQAWPPRDERIPAPPLTVPKPLLPMDTKAEQARLLTLLRSLNPVSVTDQLCKALAFFGGVPDAPPPADGVFPESASGFGPGSLFVGWLAEIFPKVNAPGSASRKTVARAPRATRKTAEPHQAPTEPVPSDTAETTTIGTFEPVLPAKRRRGRPKGSKATKVRKDKGTKRTGKKTSADAVVSTSLGSIEDETDNIAHSSACVADSTFPQPSVNSTPTAPAGEPSSPASKKRGRPGGTRKRPRNDSDPSDQSALLPANERGPGNIARVGDRGATARITSLQADAAPQKRTHGQFDQSPVPVPQIGSNSIGAKPSVTKRQRTTHESAASPIMARDKGPPEMAITAHIPSDGAASQPISASNNFISPRPTGSLPGTNSRSEPRRSHAWHTAQSADSGLLTFRPHPAMISVQNFQVINSQHTLQRPGVGQGTSGVD